MGREGFVLWEVVEEHLDDAEFLWGQLERSLGSPVHTLGEVEILEEERLLANVDGLAAGGIEVEERLLLPALADGAPGRVAAAAFTLLSSPRATSIDAVLATLREGDEVRRAATRRAVELAPRPELARALLEHLVDSDAGAQAGALEALAFRRADAGPRLASIRPGDEPRLVIAALRAMRVGRGRPLRELAAAALSSTHPGVRDEAISAGLLLGEPAAWRACQEAAGEGRAGALLLLGIGGDAVDLRLVIEATELPDRRRAALEALAASGRAAAAEACLPLLRVAATARLAGEAFATITGLQLATDASEEPREAEEPVPFADEALDESLALDPDEALPLLAPEAVETWWRENRSRFDRQRRYLAGVPLGPESLLAALENGSMRRRHALALELELRSRGRFQLETRALTARQRVELGRLRGALAAVDAGGGGDPPFGRLDFARPFG